MLEPNYNSIPQELKTLRRWVNWKPVRREGKWTKPPYQPSGEPASCDKSSTWTTFEKAVAAYQQNGAAGIGFQLGAGYIGIDVDQCRDPITGEIEDWAWDIIKELSSYTEVSPSGTGVHILLKGKLPEGGRRKGRLEMYDSGRYFTVSGAVVGELNTIQERQTELEALHRKVFGESKPELEALQPAAESSLTDAELIERACNARNGAKFRQLWNGEYEDRYPSQSEAEQALCNSLAFWTGKDPQRMDRLFRQSGLMRPKWEREDYRKRTIQEAIAGTTETYQPAQVVSIKRGAAKKAEKAPKPRIAVGTGDLAAISLQALRALEQANRPIPYLFRHADLPARIVRGDDGRPFFQNLKEDRLRYSLARDAEFYRQNKDGKQATVHPPKDIVKDILATPELPFPIVEKIVEAPVFSTDGTLLTIPGYHPKSRTYYAPAEGFSCPEIPEKVSRSDVEKARAIYLEELLPDFPFTSDSERANLMALILQSFARGLIEGPTPLYLIEKPCPGTGATLLITVATYPALGREVSAITEGHDEDEWRKRITATLRLSPTVVLIDNLDWRLRSAALSSALTAEAWEDRILGRSETIRIPIRCTWVATGNNPTLSSEIARRSIRIRLDAKQDRPWQRELESFKHPNIQQWTKQHRSELVWAALVLVKAWLQEGKPKPEDKPTLGSFESWAEVMGGILETAGIKGFLDNLTEFYDASDTEGVDLRSFVSAWWDKYGRTTVGAAKLWEMNKELDEPLDLGDKGEQSQKSRLGYRLKKIKDRRFKIETDEEVSVEVIVSAGEKKQRATQWFLKETESKW